MNLATEARTLADYIQTVNLSFEYETTSNVAYTHIGALYTDIILQAGMNYRTVVYPRVIRVLHEYPTANTVKGFIEVVRREGIANVIKWKHPDKIDRMRNLLDFSTRMSINTCDDLSDFLRIESNHEKLLDIKGIGNKTLDYTLKLLAFDTIAVDRHIYSFVEQAGLPVIDYRTTKKIVEFAADILDVSRSALDYGIWVYMSNKRNRQTTINFV